MERSPNGSSFRPLAKDNDCVLVSCLHDEIILRRFIHGWAIGDKMFQPTSKLFRHECERLSPIEIMSICTLCKAQIPDAFPEEWVTSDGQTVSVARSAVASAVIETSVGQFEICEPCYQRSMPPFFTPQDLAEIHYQFGLEYREREQFAKSVESLTHARRLSETADIIAALASAESDLGHRELAISHYRRALEIDPSHFMSRQNLQRLYDTAT